MEMKAVKKQLGLLKDYFHKLMRKIRFIFQFYQRQDPDDFIKQNGKDGMVKLLEQKEIIQSFIWNCYLSKINKHDPYEISKFEKKLKNCHIQWDKT